MTTFAFYKKVVALNSEVHRNLKFAVNEVNFAFARDTTAVLMAGVEFAEAGREYPIVFIRGQDTRHVFDYLRMTNNSATVPPGT